MPVCACLAKRLCTGTLLPAYACGLFGGAPLLLLPAPSCSGCCLYTRDAQDGAQMAAVQYPAPAASQPENLQNPGPAHITPPAVEPLVTPVESPSLEKHPLIAKNNTPVKRTVTQQPPVTVSQPARAGTGTGTTVTSNNNNTPAALAQLPQPRATSAEVVQQHLEEQQEQATAIPPVPQDAATATGSQVLASNVKLPHAPPPEPEQPAAAPAPEVQGELIMSVTSTNESKLLNGVASVAKFFSRKKHQK